MSASSPETFITELGSTGPVIASSTPIKEAAGSEIITRQEVGVLCQSTVNIEDPNKILESIELNVNEDLPKHVHVNAITVEYTIDND